VLVYAVLVMVGGALGALDSLLVDALFGVAMLVVASILLRRWITHPVDVLSDSVRAVAAGRIDQPITVTGPPELAELGQDIEYMRQRILSELDTTRRAMEALAQGAPVVLALQSELTGGLDVSLPPGLAYAARKRPAEGVLAGDWYDVVSLDADRVAVVVVDIAGHGPAAGLFALRVKHLLVTALRLGMDPGAALGWVAEELADTGEEFATGLVAQIDASTGRCRYANAGHPPGLRLSSEVSEGWEELPPTGPLLGPLKGLWATADTTLGPGDMLVLYTDGLSGARNAEGDEFAGDNLINLIGLLGSRWGDPLDSVVDDVVARASEWSAGQLKDDLTLVVVQREAIGS
jgi:HAMP domain-containing protein